MGMYSVVVDVMRCGIDMRKEKRCGSGGTLQGEQSRGHRKRVVSWKD